MKNYQRVLHLSVMMVFWAIAAAANAAPISFTGSYTENFDGLGVNGTAIPAGYSAMGISGNSATYLASNPITSTAVASAYTSGTQTLTVWNPGGSGFKLQDSLANAGAIGNTADRALGTGPTGTGATAIQLAMTNGTGAALPGISISYDMKVLANGTPKSGTTPIDESGELPGYSFFYSTTGGTTATDWIPVTALSLNGYTLGQTYNGSAQVNFASSVPSGANVYLRWVDDNSDPISPDQTFAIDNVHVNSVPEPTGLAPLGLCSIAALRRRRQAN